MSHLLPSLINLVIFPGLIASYFLLKVVGRKKILLYGTAGATICNLLLTIGFYIRDQNGYAGNILLNVGALLFMIDYGASIGPVTFAYVPEVI
jgi:hypothetical protein